MVARIAVVDNDDNILQLMEDVLADQGWEAMPFVKAEGVVETLSREQPDAIILDARVDGNQGCWRVLTQLLEGSATRAIPVAIWTGGGDGVEDKESWLAEHQVPVMHKPFELDEVYDTVGAMLQRQRASATRPETTDLFA